MTWFWNNQIMLSTALPVKLAINTKKVDSLEMDAIRQQLIDQFNKELENI